MDCKKWLLTFQGSFRVLQIFLSTLIFFYSNHVAAASYYISSSNGSDQYSSLQARNPATPWKTLDKLNSYFKDLQPGDSVLLKRGEIFYGAIVANKSGAVFAPIYIGAYGTGAKPEISGSVALTTWKLAKNGIYESPCGLPATTLIINGLQQAIGRYPNKGYLTYQSHNGINSITDNQLTEQNNWTGAEIVIRKNRWIIDRSEITNQTGATITYALGNKAVPTNGHGYFIQKSIKTLDQFGEWYYDAQSKNMLVYFGAHNPSSFAVKTNNVNNLVDICRYNYLTFENITFSGAGNNTFNITQAKVITLKNCNINQTAAIAVWASYSPLLRVDNCLIDHALSGGINLDAGCANAMVVNNTIKNIGLIPGLGKSGSGTYEGITSFGDNAKIEKNRIDSIGYNGIYFGGNSSQVKNNYITYFCLTKDDGAGIYIGDWSKTTNKKVIGNIILHGVGNSAGATNATSLQAEGIYIDDNSESVTISDNTVSLCANNGVKIHNAKDINIYNNTVVNNGVQLRLEQDHYLVSSSYIRNNMISNNIFVSINNLQPNAKFSTHQDDIASFGKLDSNFYCRPNLKLAGVSASVVKNGKGSSQLYDFSNWKSAYGQDAFSNELLSNESVLFEYNPTNTAKTISLKTAYADVHKNVYTKNVTLEPYSSIILIASVAKSGKNSQSVLSKSYQAQPYIAAVVTKRRVTL
jgi:parallel beta-helix repeat protein